MPFGVGPQYLNPYMGYSSTQGPSFHTGTGTTAPGGAGTLTPGSAYSFTPAYGGKPSVPDPNATAAAAAAGNTGNLAGLSALGQGVNQFNTEQLNSMLSSMIPQYAGMTQQASSDILQNLAGNVPTDVINQIIQSAAERGVVTGGGPNANAAYLRALGLTSLGQQAAGQQQLNARIGATPVPKPFDVTSGMVTPEQQQSAQTAANLYAAAPDPMQASQAAMNALLGGMGAGGAGVHGATPMTPYQGGSFMPNLNNTGMGSYYGGVYYPAGVTSGAGAAPYSPAGAAPFAGSTGQLGPFSDVPSGTISTPGSSYFDPYATSTGGSSYDFSSYMNDQFAPQNEPPPGTISTGNQSTYDPFAGLTGGASYDFSSLLNDIGG